MQRQNVICNVTPEYGSGVWGNQYFAGDSTGGYEPTVSGQVWDGGVSGKGSAWHTYCEGSDSVDGNGVCVANQHAA